MIIFRNSTILAFSKMIIPHEHPFQLIETIILKEIETFMMGHPTQKSYQEVPKRYSK